MGADPDGRGTAGRALQRSVALRLFHLAGQQADLDAKRRQPSVQGTRVLLDQQFGRRHQHRLQAAERSTEHRGGGDHGLAGTDIALDQPQHRLAQCKIVRDVGNHAPLCAGHRERQLFLQLGSRRQHRFDARAGRALRLLAQQTHAQLVRQQFFAHQPDLRRVTV